MKGLTARRIGRACAIAYAMYDSVTIGAEPGDYRYAGPYMIVHGLATYVGVVFVLFIYTQIKEALQNKKRRTANERVCNCR
jgi:hypothetical protein